MKDNVFNILGIADNELAISSFFYYLLNKEDSNIGGIFLEDICSLAGYENLCVDDFTVSKEKKSGKNIFDLLVEIKDKQGKTNCVVCIENKVLSSEGPNQTKRYVEEIRHHTDYENLKHIFIYLSKDRLSLHLSSDEFKQVTYVQLEKTLTREEFKSVKLVDEFLALYVTKYKSDIEQTKVDLVARYCDIEKLRLYEYIAYLINGDNENKKFVAGIGNSMKSSQIFLQIMNKSWVFKLSQSGFDVNVHLELKGKFILVHFEPYPYQPVKSLLGTDKKISEEYLNYYNSLKRKVAMVKPDINVFSKSIPQNHILTVGRFEMSDMLTGIQYIENVRSISLQIDDVIREFKKE